jgi:thiopeptide-type bacteriocin biosynthesis protein
MSAFRSFGHESAAEAAQAIADAWEVTLEQWRSRKSFDLTMIGGIGLAIASPGTMLAGTGAGPAGSVLCEFRSDMPHFLAPRPQPLTFAARCGGLIPGPLVQARSWFRDWSDEGVEALDVVGADPMNPNAALVASVAETVIDASSVADLAEWTLGSDAHGRPWLFDALGVPHIALVHHASVFGIADCGSALLRRISNGFGWELPACLFPILPAERRRWRHLPMLTIRDDLVVSCERWILESEDLVAVGSGADSIERFSRWCRLVRRLELPASVVLRRSGSPNEPGQTILTDSILCVESFLDRLEGIPRQLVLEAGPTVCDGLPMADGQRHLVQLVVSWRDRDHWSDHPPPKAGPQAAMAPSWTQLNLHFEVGESGPRIPWRELSELFAAWTNDGVIRRWFFVRKPPGLRVRLDAADPKRLGARIRTWEAMRTSQTWFSRLCTARVSVYEPEYERMGGALGLDLLHDMLCATTSIVLRLEQESAGRELRYPIAALGANWFLEHARLDAAEMADVWQRLDRCFDRTEAGEDSGTFRALTDPVGFADQLPDDLRTVSEELMGVAQTLGTRAQQLANGGTLAVGLRAWLADAILFQWNMYGLGLDLPAMASMVRVGTRLSLASRM